MSLNSEYFSQHATVAIQSSPTVLVSNSPALGGLMNSDSLFLLNIMDMLGFGLIAGNECQTMIMRMICQYLPVF